MVLRKRSHLDTRDQNSNSESRATSKFTLRDNDRSGEGTSAPQRPRLYGGPRCFLRSSDYDLNAVNTNRLSDLIDSLTADVVELNGIVAHRDRFALVDLASNDVYRRGSCMAL